MSGTDIQRVSVREAAAQATRERVLDAAAEAFAAGWYEDVTLRDVARAAGVALQTVVNHFGTKEALYAAATERIHERIAAARTTVTPGDLDGAVAALVADYERTGDYTLRTLALEGRVAVVAPVLAVGRAGHEWWVEHVFAAALDGLSERDRRRRRAQLVAVTDVFTWKLLRRDKGLGVQDTITAMRELVAALHDLKGDGT
jgi:AcrR family transcriptional regulator